MHDHAGHSHGYGAHALEARREDSRRRLWIALAINLALLVFGVVGGLITGSLAVLADAGHVLSDAGAIALALFAAHLAALPAAGRRTFGYQRSEVLVALVNGLTLVAVSIAIAIAAFGRFSDPPEIEGWGVLAIGLIGLLGNLAATWVLARGQREDINLEGALRHSAADALGSVGVLVAGAWVLLGGSPIVDPIVGLLIAVLVLASSWRLIKEPLDVLMEAAPAQPRRRAARRRDLRRAGRAVGPRSPRLDRHRRVRRDRRARGRRRRCRPRSGPAAARGGAGRGVRDRAHDAADGGGGRRRPPPRRERPRTRLILVAHGFTASQSRIYGHRSNPMGYL